MESQLDVIIPVYKPGKELLELIQKLKEQEYPVNRIIIMNTEQKYFDRLTYGTSFYEKYPMVSVCHVSKREFDHGATRRMGVRKSEAPYFLMMTQDALPVNTKLTAELMRAVSGEKIAAAYARQLPAEGCGEVERFTRDYNYPDSSVVKTGQDIKRLGIKTYFCSNVCALYNRSIYEATGGFPEKAIFNEDMVYAAGAVKAGYGIAYCAQAEVIHSHNYTGREQFHRNFDLGVSQADHPEVFEEVPSESEGMRMVRMTAGHLRHIGKRRKIPGLLYVSGCKYFGYLLGKSYRKLPKAWILRFTANKDYWLKYRS